MNDTAERAILERLRESDSPLSGESLARELGVSRVALWKRVEALKAWGYGISASHRGYVLVEDDGLAPFDAAGPSARTMIETSSTMDEARRIAFEGAPAGSLVLALRQKAGRGRNGRAWESPEGGLYLSMVLKTGLPPSCSGAIVLEAALVLKEILETAGARDIRFRWPNDLMAGDRKLGGILVEQFGGMDRADFYILGIGLNVAPRDIPERAAACLAELAPALPRRRDIARLIADRMLSWSGTPSLAPERWERTARWSSRPALVRMWDGGVRRLTPRGFSPRGELLTDSGYPLSIGECAKITYEGEQK